jgi:hypothetical protein
VTITACDQVSDPFTLIETSVPDLADVLLTTAKARLPAFMLSCCHATSIWSLMSRVGWRNVGSRFIRPSMRARVRNLVLPSRWSTPGRPSAGRLISHAANIAPVRMAQLWLSPAPCASPSGAVDGSHADPLRAQPGVVTKIRRRSAGVASDPEMTAFRSAAIATNALVTDNPVLLRPAQDRQGNLGPCPRRRT